MHGIAASEETGSLLSARSHDPGLIRLAARERFEARENEDGFAGGRDHQTAARRFEAEDRAGGLGKQSESLLRAGCTVAHTVAVAREGNGPCAQGDGRQGGSSGRSPGNADAPGPALVQPGVVEHPVPQGGVRCAGLLVPRGGELRKHCELLPAVGTTRRMRQDRRDILWRKSAEGGFELA